MSAGDSLRDWAERDRRAARRHPPAHQKAALQLALAKTAWGDVPAYAALCFAGESSDLLPREHRGITVLSLRYLEAWLRSRPAALDATRIDALAGHLRRTTRSAASVPPARALPPLPAPPRRRRSHRAPAGRSVPASRRVQRRMPRPARVLVGLVIMLVVLSALPAVLTGLMRGLQHGLAGVGTTSRAGAAALRCPSAAWLSMQWGHPVVAQPAPVGECRYASAARPAGPTVVLADGGRNLTRASWEARVHAVTGSAGCGAFTAAYAQPAGSGLLARTAEEDAATAVGTCLVLPAGASAADAGRARAVGAALVHQLRLR